MVEDRLSGSYFVAGGTVPADSPSYVERSADRELTEALIKGEFCYVLNSRQMGKSSLAVRTIAKLKSRGVRTAFLDLTRFGGGQVSIDQWYAGLLIETGRAIGMREQAVQFMGQHSALGPTQRYLDFLSEVASFQTEPIAILIDEIDAVRSLSFSTDDLFAGMRQLYNGRTIDPQLNRLTFCLLGAALPSQLIRDARTTPFNIGHRIDLKDFTLEEASPFAEAMGPHGHVLLERVFHWTNGHPFLTQKLCAKVATEQTRDVDRLVEEMYLNRRAQESDTNLADVANRLLGRGDPAVTSKDQADTLSLLSKVAKGGIIDDEANPAVARIKLSGIARLEKGQLTIRNRIYARIFSLGWIRSNTPGQELRRQKAAFYKGVLRTGVVATTIIAVIGLLAWNSYRLEKLAQRQRNEAEYQAYLSTVNFMRSAYDAGDYSQLGELLDKTAQSRYCNFEWNYWKNSYLKGRGKPIGNPGHYNNCGITYDGKYVSVQDLENRTADIYSYPQLKLQRHLSDFPSSRFLAYVRGHWIEIDQAASDHIPITDLNGKPLADVRFPNQTYSGWSGPPDSSHEVLTLRGKNGGNQLAVFDCALLKFTAKFSEPINYTFATSSYDGRYIAALCDDHPSDAFIDVYEARTGKLIDSVKHLGIVYENGNIQFSMDGVGRLLAWGQSDGRLIVRDVVTRRNLLSKQVSDLPVISAMLSKDGKLAMSVSSNCKSELWDVISGGLRLGKNGIRLPSQDNALSVVVSSGTGSCVVPLRQLPDNSIRVPGALDLEVMPDHRFWVLTGSEWRVFDLKLRGFLPGRFGVSTYQSAFFGNSCFNPHGHIFLQGRSGLWTDVDTTSGETVTRQFRPGEVPLQTLQNGDTLVRDFSQVEIHCVSPSGQTKWAARLRESAFVCALSPDDRYAVLSEGWLGALEVVDLSQGKVVKSSPGLGNTINSLAFSPDDTTVAGANATGEIFLFPISPSDQSMRRLNGHPAKVTCLSFSPDGKRLLSGSYDGTLRLWDTSNGQEMLRIAGYPQLGARFDSTGSKIVSLDLRGRISIYDGSPNGA